MNYLGEVIPGHSPYIGIFSGNVGDSTINLGIYETGVIMDNTPEFAILGRGQINKGLTGSMNTRPCDFNGDGFDDMVAYERGADFTKLLVYLGGEPFDTIPDWQKVVVAPGNFSPKYSAGYDVNGDGCGDILIRTYPHPDTLYLYRLFLGGSPPDTNPALQFRWDQFPGYYTNRQMNSGFSLLPDVNGDGYDEMGIQYWEYYAYPEPDRRPFEDMGYLVFFGGERLDLDADLDLDGEILYESFGGCISGGDFNDDGYGDVVTGNPTGMAGQGEVHIHFGSRWMDGSADIIINGERDYGRDFEHMGAGVGAVGDYNGDGVDDFVTGCGGNINRLAILAGNGYWEVGVKDKVQPDSHNIRLSVHPNPFNKEVSVCYKIPADGRVMINIYSVRGELITILVDTITGVGEHQASWTHRTAGIYLVSLEYAGSRVVRKIVCMP
jgi:hypothetical protein